MTESGSPVRRMFETHPRRDELKLDLNTLTECIDACFECTQVCTACADACLGEREHLPHLRRCITLNLACAATCAATGRALLRQTEPDSGLLRALLEACRTACRACAEECEGHASDMNMQHCAVCAESCRRCEHACQELLGSLQA